MRLLIVAIDGYKIPRMATPIDLYAYVMAFLDSRAIPQRRVAAGAGVPFSTVAKIAQRVVTDPSVHTVQKLADYFAREGVQPAPPIHYDEAA